MLVVSRSFNHFRQTTLGICATERGGWSISLPSVDGRSVGRCSLYSGIKKTAWRSIKRGDNLESKVVACVGPRGCCSVRAVCAGASKEYKK